MWIVLILIIVIIISIVLIRLKFGVQTSYRKYVEEGLSRINREQDIINEIDLTNLPRPIKKYLDYIGIVGSEQVTHFKVEFDGQMCFERGSDWAPFSGEQHTFLDDGVRLFLLSMKYKGILVNGLHHFYKQDATMVIKILDLIKVADNRGEIMKKAETVTYFNDLCIFAPSILITENILWETIDDTTVKGIFTHDDITVSAIIYFDDLGRLINFVSEDRYAIQSDGSYKNVPWSTPMSEYKIINGLNVPVVGEAIWHYEDGDFTYIKLNVKDVILNP